MNFQIAGAVAAAVCGLICGAAGALHLFARSKTTSDRAAALGGLVLMGYGVAQGLIIEIGQLPYWSSVAMSAAVFLTAFVLGGLVVAITHKTT